MRYSEAESNDGDLAVAKAARPAWHKKSRFSVRQRVAGTTVKILSGNKNQLL